jgi:hypothetical protein
VDEGTPQLVKDLRVLVDPAVAQADERLDVSQNLKLSAARRRIKQYFDAHEAVSAVTVFVTPWRVGVITRDSLGATGRMAGTAAEPSQVGTGDRIQLPGASTRYRLLTLRCASCGVTAHRVFYDPRDLPACEHGMELVREA